MDMNWISESQVYVGVEKVINTSRTKLPSDSDKIPKILLLTSLPRDSQMMVLIQQRPHPYSTEDRLLSPWNTLSAKGKTFVTF